jgi:hydroxyethylthiazole kinase-like uncharacterized protein yjeF
MEYNLWKDCISITLIALFALRTLTRMTALYSVAEIREIEQTVSTVLPRGSLMQRAGLAAAIVAQELAPSGLDGSQVLVLAGPGDNGGDALEAAFHLAQAGLQVSILLFADPVKQSTDSRDALKRAQSSSARFMDPSFSTNIAAIPWALIVDGMFGIGLMRPIVGDMHTVVEKINSLSCAVLSLDVPSGLDADTGDIVGENGIAVHASQTITFIADKPGLHTGNGPDYAGKVRVARLDIARRYFKAPHAKLNEVTLFSDSLRSRPRNSHKGSFGDVIIIGGAHGMGGAPVLAARAAAKSGAGRVFAAFIGEVPSYDSMQPELMCRLAAEMDFSTATLVVGPGLGRSRDAHDLVAKALDTDRPLVLDADALNLISAEPGLQQKLTQRGASTLLTPHPLEAARLLATSSAVVQADRLAAARELARRFNSIVVLKGAGTVIAHPNGNVAINTTGNPGLATAGTGDVLAGICGALLAQHWDVWNAALGAVWLHGRAADVLVGQGIGPIGLTASELIPAVRNELNKLVSKYDRRTTR